MESVNPLGYHPPPVGELRPHGRREAIRDSLETGNWQAAAQLLHEAHTAQEWRGCAFSSWSDYVVTLGISRMYDWQLRLTIRHDTARTSYSVRAAIRQAQAQRTT